jgi:hypothetical protein
LKAGKPRALGKPLLLVSLFKSLPQYVVYFGDLHFGFPKTAICSAFEKRPEAA